MTLIYSYFLFSYFLKIGTLLLSLPYTAGKCSPLLAKNMQNPMFQNFDMVSSFGSLARDSIEAPV